MDPHSTQSTRGHHDRNAWGVTVPSPCRTTCMMNTPTQPERPNIRVATLPERLGAVDQRTTVVVIDTLRFTSCACTALAHQASAIHVAGSISEAMAQRDALSGPVLLCGERECKPIPGFDLGNSPSEYTRGRVGGRTLIFTTTNGTRAVAAAQRAGTILLGSLLNRQAIARFLWKSSRAGPSPADIRILCAGTNGTIAGEDLLTAGAILAAGDFPVTDEDSLQALALWNRVCSKHVGDPQSGQPLERESIQTFFAQTDGGKNLIAAGYQDDLALAAELDRWNVIPRLVSPDCGFQGVWV
ncbi:MAG: 2-phosphosulfolactate phosphatase [Planctomycetota bacterium]|nr:MAG: 2-phosphosulfolactate phosphatase [Planctomycetota bacterium]